MVACGGEREAASRPAETTASARGAEEAPGRLATGRDMYDNHRQASGPDGTLGAALRRSMTMPDEFDLIARYFTRPAAPGDGVWLGIGDDAAVLDVPPDHLVTDAMVCHPIPAEADAARFGSWVIAQALTHLAASGARPRWATLALTLPAPDEKWLEGFGRAFLDTAHRHRVRLVGGDTTQGPAALAVAAFGLLPEERPSRPRIGPGDLVMMVAVASPLPEAPVSAGMALRPFAGAVVPACDGVDAALVALLEEIEARNRDVLGGGRCVVEADDRPRPPHPDGEDPVERGSRQGRAASGSGTTIRRRSGRLPDAETRAPVAADGRMGLCFTLATRHESALRERLARPRHEVHVLGVLDAMPPRAGGLR